MHDFGDILYWAVNKHCRAHPRGPCDLVQEVQRLLQVAREGGALASGLAGVTAYVRKHYGEEAALAVALIGAVGILAALSARLQQLGLAGPAPAGGYLPY